jgi:hypothetical protein
MDHNAKPSRAEALVGLCGIGALTTGYGSLLVALAALLDVNYSGAGLAMLAAAFAFGLLANSLFRS